MNRKVLDAAVVFASVALCQQTARADVYASNYSVTEVTSNPSIMAAYVMGALGYANYTPPSGLDWRGALGSSCQDWTTRSLGRPSLWTGGCDPTGMASAISEVAHQTWVTLRFSAADQVIALDRSIYALASHYHSPAVVPIFGQADHWVAVYQVDATPVSSTHYTLNKVLFYDALGASTDAGSNMAFSGISTLSGTIWKRMYFMVINAINPTCDPNCSSDPFYNQYVVTWDPPFGASLLNHTDAPAPVHFTPVPARGLVGPGQSLSPVAAQAGVFQSLRLAGLDKNPEIWSAISAGSPGAARLVSGYDPSGQPWNYYLVPIYDGAGAVVTLVELSASDGAFEGSFTPEKPIVWQPIEPAAAAELAAKSLEQGERLGAGSLSWNPASNDIHVKAPHLPFYEFPVLDPSGRSQNILLVTLHGGQVIRQAARPARQVR